MRKIIVDCERNDPVDIRCGGPVTLGFDFFVNDEEADDMISFIKKELNKNKLPLMAINHYQCQDTTPWTKEMIRNCIREGY